MTETNKTALVTGANSGLGFEASAQLAEQGYDRVIITARSAAKAETAHDQLLARTGKEVFERLTLDNHDLATVESAAGITGKFFASPPKKMVGSLVEIRMDHLDKPAAQRALWNVTAKTVSRRSGQTEKT